MKFNVTLDKEQIDEIACITADKVLSTVEYQKKNESWYEDMLQRDKQAIQERDSRLVQKDIIIDRLREQLRKARAELKELKDK